MEEGGNSTLSVQRSLEGSHAVEQLVQPLAEIFLPQVWHVLKNCVPILYKLLLADVLAPVLVNFSKERLDPRISNIDVEWKMMIEDVNEFELSLRHMTVSADIELVEDSFWVRHRL